MKTIEQIKMKATDVLAQKISEGYFVTEAYTSNSMPRYYMQNKNNERAELVISTRTMTRSMLSKTIDKNLTNHFSLTDIIEIKFDNETIETYYEAPTARGRLYATTIEELMAVAEKRNIRMHAQFTKSNRDNWRPAPQSLVNRAKKLRGFGVATKNNLTVRREGTQMTIRIQDERVKPKIAIFC